MEKTNAPGAGILKVIGIVGLVLSGISGLMMSIAVLVDEQGGMGTPPMPTIYYLWAFALLCYCIYICIMALINCKNLEKAELLLTLGYINIGLGVVNAIVDIVLVGLAAVMMLPVAFAISILYIVGAFKNKKMFDNQLSQQRTSSTDSQCAIHNG